MHSMKSVNLDDEYHEKLTEHKKKTGVPIKETVQRAIDEYIEKRKQGVK